MRLSSQIIGALNGYSSTPRAWSEEDRAAPTVLADVVKEGRHPARREHARAPRGHEDIAALANVPGSALKLLAHPFPQK